MRCPPLVWGSNLVLAGGGLELDACTLHSTLTLFPPGRGQGKLPETHSWCGDCDALPPVSPELGLGPS